MGNMELLQKEMATLDDKIVKRYYPDKEYDTSDRISGREYMWLKGSIMTVLMDDNIDTEKAIEEITSMIKESDYEKELMDYIELEEIIREVNIRNDFDAALEKAKKGRDLSYPLSYGFSRKDIAQLALLHKEDKHRDKIEDLLEDCNFHYESSKFSEGVYEEFLQEEE